MLALKKYVILFLNKGERQEGREGSRIRHVVRSQSICSTVLSSSDQSGRYEQVDSNQFSHTLGVAYPL